MHDLIITAANIAFLLATLPQVFKLYKLKRGGEHSYLWHGVTVIFLFILAFVYYDLAFYASVATISLSCLLRAIIIAQMLYYRNIDLKQICERED
jgi:hypothetical protein